MTYSNDTRRADLAKIHLAKKQLGMTDDVYRDMLWTIARVRSAADLDEHGRRAVIEHLKKCGARFTHKRRIRPAGNKAGLIAKVQAFLAEAKRPDSYADGMAQHMFQVERIEWCTTEQLGKIIAALMYDAKRHGRRTR